MPVIVFVEVDPAVPHGDGCGCWSCEYDRDEEQRRRQVSRCPGHDWELVLEHPEDGSGVALSCTHCPAGVDDVYPDGTDMVYVDLDNGVRVEAGKHDSPVPLVVPVGVTVEAGRNWTDYGRWDYDADLVVEQRGPVRPVDEDDAP